MENQEMKSFVDNHPAIKFMNDRIASVNEAINYADEEVKKGIRESSDNSPDIDENGIDWRARVANLPGFLDAIGENLTETRSLDNLLKLRNYLETLKSQLEAKLIAEYVTGQPGIENFDELLNSPRAEDIGIPKGELIKIFAVDTDNTLTNGLTNALNAFDNSDISFNDLTKYTAAIRDIAQYDNFGIFIRSNRDLIMNPTPDNINKLKENVAALKLEQQKKEENKIIPKGKDESNKIIPQKGKSKGKTQTKFWKWQK